MTRAVVAGALANKPHNGGEAWVRLSWVLGLAGLGIETWFVEEIERDSPVADHRWLEDVVGRFGLAGRAALVDGEGRSLVGVSDDALADAMRGAEVLFNISGNLACESLLCLPAARAYVDLDPGYTHYWHAQGALGSELERHDVFLTVALAIGRDECLLPTGGLDWRPVAPPVVLEAWPSVEPCGEQRFTTVAAWRGGYGRVEHDGRIYGQKAHEFRRFARVPEEVDATFEIALDIHPGDQSDIDLLADGGWRLVDPRAATGDPDAFRRFVQGSAAEFSPSQGIYAETNSGWFSDRTARYLASGRPAVVQETGLPREIPRGEGLLTFTNVEEARDAARAVLQDYERHARAARLFAEEHLASEKVLGRVLEDVLA